MVPEVFGSLILPFFVFLLLNRHNALQRTLAIFCSHILIPSKIKREKKNDLGNQGPVKGPWEAQTDPTNFSQRKAI